MASKRTVIRKPTRPKPVAPTQAERIVTILTRWCDAAPGRRVTLTRTQQGWAAQLDERRGSTGTTALDALAQIAVAASFETHMNESLEP